MARERRPISSLLPCSGTSASSPRAIPSATSTRPRSGFETAAETWNARATTAAAATPSATRNVTNSSFTARNASLASCLTKTKTRWPG